jgi:hypothetical protein
VLAEAPINCAKHFTSLLEHVVIGSFAATTISSVQQMPYVSIHSQVYTHKLSVRLEFEVFTAVVMKSIIFWDVTPCSLFSWNRCFGAKSRLHQACHLLTCWFLLKLFIRPWSWRRYVPPKRRLQLNKLHGVTCQMMIFFCSFVQTFQQSVKGCIISRKLSTILSPIATQQPQKSKCFNYKHFLIRHINRHLVTQFSVATGNKQISQA